MMVKLWLATAAALLIAGLAVAETFAAEPGLKLPPAAAAPAPQQPAPAPDAQEFYRVPARTLEQVTEIINAQRREIEWLRATANGSCI